MKLQRSVVRHGCALMDKNSVTRLKRFRYAFLQALPDGDQDVFSKPIALSKLALFLVDANRVRQRTTCRRCQELVPCLLTSPACLFSLGHSNLGAGRASVHCPLSFYRLTRSRICT